MGSGGQGVGQRGPRGSKGWAYTLPGGQGGGLQGLRELSVRPTTKGVV